MKKITGLLTCILLLQHFSASAQSFAINTTGAAANGSAMLDVSSTTKGLLIPRMTKTERNGIVSPATGLMIYQTGPDSIGFHYYNGSSWSWVSSSTNGSCWKLLGNTGTDTASNFIGTTDNMALRFKINNLQAGLLSGSSTAFGLGAAKAPGTSTGITAMGIAALGLNNNKNDLVAIGDSALYNNSTGASIFYHSTGNAAFGSKALLKNTTGYMNTATGTQALTANLIGYFNTANGYQTLYSNVLGYLNTAIGYKALFSNQAESNTAVGALSMNGNLGGSQNTAMGTSSLSVNVVGNANTAIGSQSLFLSTASDNTAVGSLSMYRNTTGLLNTATGYASLYNNNTGNKNTALGDWSLENNDVGSYNTGIGDSSNVLQSNLSNATAIGAKSAVNCNNCLVLGSVNGINGATANVNVGIGETNPTVPLNFASALGNKISLWGNGSNHYGLGIQPSLLQLYTMDASNDIAFGYGNSAAFTENVRIKGNGTTVTKGLQVSNGTVFTKMQSGTLYIGPSASSQMAVTLTFPVPFTSSTPRVFVTARNQSSTSYNDAFSVSIRSVTATTVTFNIQRTDSNAAWAQLLNVDWFAVE